MAQGTNGAWLALGVAGAVAAASALRGGKGSGNRSLSSLSDEQLSALKQILSGDATLAQEQRLSQQGVDANSFSERDVLKQVERRQFDLVQRHFPRAGGTSADWSVYAWDVDGANPRTGFDGERFIILDDDGDWSLVRRWSSEDNDDIETVQSFNSFSDLKRWIAGFKRKQ